MSQQPLYKDDWFSRWGWYQWTRKANVVIFLCYLWVLFVLTQTASHILSPLAWTGLLTVLWLFTLRTTLPIHSYNTLTYNVGAMFSGLMNMIGAVFRPVGRELGVLFRCLWAVWSVVVLICAIIAIALAGYSAFTLLPPDGHAYLSAEFNAHKQTLKHIREGLAPLILTSLFMLINASYRSMVRDILVRTLIWTGIAYLLYSLVEIGEGAPAWQAFTDTSLLFCLLVGLFAFPLLFFRELNREDIGPFRTPEFESETPLRTRRRWDDDV